MTKRCEHCGREYATYPSANARFCCRYCYDRWLDVRFPGRRDRGPASRLPVNVAGWKQAVERGVAADFADRIVKTRPVPPGLLAAIRTFRPPATLTAGQLRCVEAAADGLTNQEIAAETGLAELTVRANLKAAYRRMGVRNRVEAARVVWEARDAA